MQVRHRLLLLSALFCGVMVHSSWAQQDPFTAPPPNPAPSKPDDYPDLDSLREPGSSAKLFPTPTPPPVTNGAGVVGGGGGGNGGRRNNPLMGGQRRRNGRTNDMLSDQASNDPLDLRVAYRRAKTEAMVRDPGLVSLVRQADAAKTDVDKRAILKVYYARLFAEVRKVDSSPEMKRHTELLALVAQQRYDPQRRVVGGEEDIVRGGGGRRGRAQ